ncbi:hypothetical protein [Catellatospora sichuanensis]|uniref:hypothetical protein n=1 Tax=Catellatospora sichuanensis TaxID=1969805 RepID=UPI0011823F8C|nr:hypothetical protein [Catellatospora sichuanensis]
MSVMLRLARRVILRQRRPPSSAVTVYAVRMDWADRTHQFVDRRSSPERALLAAARLRAYWRRSPVRPTLSVAALSEHEFALHRRRRDCRSPDCAVAASVESRSVVA